MKNLAQPLLVITGPTGSGKGAVAFEIAKRLQGEIVSIDSMKIYRELDVVTAKPSADRRESIPHHLLDLVEPHEAFSTGDYLEHFWRVVGDIESRGKRPILSGGTALYLKGILNGFSELPAADWDLRNALLAEAEEVGVEVLHERLRGVDPKAGERILSGDLRRIVRALEVFETSGRPLSESWEWETAPQVPARLFGLGWERQELYARTDRRVLRMVERGLFDEAERMAQRQPPASRSAMQCIGYKEVLEGRAAGQSREEIIELIQRNTRRLAKRQLTWCRKLPVDWLPVRVEPDVASLATTILERLETNPEAEMGSAESESAKGPSSTGESTGPTDYSS